MIQLLEQVILIQTLKRGTQLMFKEAQMVVVGKIQQYKETLQTQVLEYYTNT